MLETGLPLKHGGRLMLRLSSWFVLLAAATAAFCAGDLLAVDGVLEINAACAVNSGCFPGDTAGYPVTITASAPARSFVLTSDLGPLTANQTAISISVNAVTVDLGGFRIYGGTSCTVVPVTCSPLGSGIGVSGGSDVTVRNGTVQGMGDDGVQISYSSHAENLHLLQNGGDGLSLGNESLARGNVITSNGNDGIRCGNYCGIHQNTVVGNGDHGIHVTSGTVTANSSSGNGLRGGSFGSDTLLTGNTFVNNVAPNVSGGHAAGGNFCSDHSCTTHGERRFYLTQNYVNGANALTACAAGFHMASLWELLDVSNFRYDTLLGTTADDSGQGPFVGGGWVRTGTYSYPGVFDPGSASCSAWTSSSGTQNGSLAGLDTYWNDSNVTDIPPWYPFAVSCNNVNKVWCVED